jgi:hypothetical protein
MRDGKLLAGIILAITLASVTYVAGINLIKKDCLTIGGFNVGDKTFTCGLTKELK